MCFYSWVKDPQLQNYRQEKSCGSTNMWKSQMPMIMIGERKSRGPSWLRLTRSVYCVQQTLDLSAVDCVLHVINIKEQCLAFFLLFTPTPSFLTSRRPSGRSSTTIRALKWRCMKRAGSTRGIPLIRTILTITILFDFSPGWLGDNCGYRGNSEWALILQQILCVQLLCQKCSRRATGVSVYTKTHILLLLFQ